MKKKLLLIAVILMFINKIISQTNYNFGINTVQPTHTLHVVVNPNNLNKDPLRLENLQLYTNQSNFLVVNPNDGVIKYMPIFEVINQMQNYDSIVLNSFLNQEDTIFANADIINEIINIVSQNMGALIINESDLIYHIVKDSIENDQDLINFLKNEIDSDIDSISYINDTLFLFEDGKMFSVEIKSGINEDLFDSLFDNKYNDLYIKIRDSLLLDLYFINSIDSLIPDTDEQNLDSMNLQGTVLEAFIQNGDSASVNLLGLSNDNNFNQNIENKLVNSANFLNFLTNYINLNDNQNIDSVKLNGVNLEIFINNGDSASVSLIELSNDSNFNNNIANYLSLNNIFNNNIANNLLNNNVFVNSLNDSIDTDEQNLDSMNLSGTVLEAFIQNGDSASVNLLGLSNDNNFNQNIENKLVNSANFLNFLTNYIDLRDNQNIDSVILNGVNLEIFINNGDSASVSLIELSNDSNFNNNIANYLLLNNIFNNNIANNLLNNNVFVNSMSDSIDTDEQNLDSMNLSGTVLEAFIQNGDSASVNLLGLSNDNNFNQNIENKLVNSANFLNFLTNYINLNDNQNIDSVKLNGVNLEIFINNGDSASVSLIELSNDSNFNNNIANYLSLNNIFNNNIANNLLNNNVFVNSMSDSIDSDEQNLDSMNLSGTVLEAFIQNGDSASVNLLGLSNDNNFNQNIENKLVNSANFLNFLTNYINLNDNQNIDSVKLNGVNLEIFINNGDSASVSLIELSNDSNFNNNIANYLSLNNIFNNNIANNLLNNNVFVNSLNDSIDTDEQNLDSMNLSGTVLEAFIQNGDSASVNLLGLSNDNNFNQNIENKLVNSANFLNFLTNYINLNDNQNIDSVKLNGVNLEIFINNGDSASVSLIELSNDSNFNNNIANYLSLNNIFNNNIANNLLNNNVFVNSMSDSIDSDEQNLDSMNLSGTVLEAFIQNGDSASVNLLGLSNDNNFNQNIENKLINSANFLNFLTNYINLNDNQNIDSVILNGVNLEIFINNGDSASVSLIELSKDSNFNNNIANYLSLNNIFNNNIANNLLNNNVFVNSLTDSIDTDEQNLDSMNLQGTVLEAFIQNGDSASVNLLGLSNDNNFNQNIENKLVNSANFLNFLTNYIDLRDNQNIDSVKLNGVNLEIFINNGDSASVSLIELSNDSNFNNNIANYLSLNNIFNNNIANNLLNNNVFVNSLTDSIDTDEQNLDSMNLSGTVLEAFIQNGDSASVNLLGLSNDNNFNQNIENKLVNSANFLNFLTNYINLNDNQNIDSVKLNGVNLEIFINNGDSASVSLIELSNDSNFNNNIANYLSLNNIFNNNIANNLLNNNVFVNSLTDSIDTDEQNLDSLNLSGTVLEAFIQNGDSASVNLLGLSNDNNFNQNIENKLVNSANFLNFLTNYINLNDNQNIDSVKLNGVNLEIFINNGDSASVSLIELSNDSNFNNNIANYLSLNNIFNNNIANNLLNNNVFVNSLNDSIDTDEQNLDSLNLSGTVLEAFIQNGDSASVNLLGLSNDNNFNQNIENKLVNSANFLNFLTNYINLNDNQNIDSVKLNGVNLEIFINNGDSASVSLIELSNDSNFNNNIANYLSLNNIFNNNIANNLLNNNVFVNSLTDSIDTDEQNLDSMNLSGTVLEAFIQNGDSASVNLLGLSNDNNFNQNIENKLVNSANFLNFLTNYIDLRDNQNIDSVKLNGVNLEIFINNGDSASVSLIELSNDSNFNNNIANYLSLNNIFNNNIANNLLNNNVFVNSMSDSIDTDEQNMDSMNLSGTVLEAFIQNGDSASVNLLGLSTDNNFNQNIENKLVNSANFLNFLTNYIDLRDNQNIDSVKLNGVNLEIFINNGDSASVSLIELSNDSNFNNNIANYLSLNNIFNNNIANNLLNNNVFVNSLTDSIDTDEQNMDSMNLSGTVLEAFIQNGDSASVNLLGLSNDNNFNQNIENKLVNSANFLNFLTNYIDLRDNQNIDSVKLNGVNLEIFINNGDSASVSLIELSNDSNFNNNIANYLSLNNIFNNNIANNLLNNNVFVNSMSDSIDTDEQNLDSMNLQGTVLEAFIQNGDSASVNLLGLSNDNNFNQNIENKLVNSANFLNFLTNYINLNDNQNIDSVKLNGVNLEIFINNGDSASVSLIELSNDSNFNNNIANYLSLNNIFNNNIANNLLNNNVFVNSMSDSIDTDEQNLDSMNLQGTVLEAFIQNGDSASVNLLGLSNDNNFNQNIENKLVNSVNFLNFLTNYINLNDNQDIDSVKLNGVNLEIFINNGDSASVSLIELSKDSNFNNNIANYLSLNNIFNNNIANNLLNNNVFVNSMSDSIDTDEQNLDSMNLQGTVLEAFIQNGDSASVNLLGLSNDNNFNQNIENKLVNSANFLNFLTNYIDLRDNQNIDSVKLNGVNLEIFINNGDSASVSLIELSNDSNFNNNIANYLSLNNIFNNNIANNLLNNNVFVSSMSDSIDTDEQNLDSMNLSGTVLEAFIQNGDSASVNLLGLSNDNNFNQNIENKLVSSANFLNFLTNYINLNDNQNIDSVKLNGVNLEIFINNGDSASVSLIELSNDSNFNNNIANYLSLNNIFNNNIANNLLNNNVFVNSLNDSIDTDEQNLDSMNLSGTVLEAFIQNGDSASVNLLGLSNDNNFNQNIENKLVNSANFLNFLTNYINLNDNQNIDSVKLNGVNLEIFINNGDSASVSLIELSNDSNFNNNIANYLSLNNIFNNNIANNLLNNNVFVNSLTDSIDTDEQNLDSLNLSGTVLEAFIQNGDSASVNLLGLSNDNNFNQNIENKLVNSANFLNFLTNYINLNDNQNIDSVKLNGVNLEIFINNGDSASVSLIELSNDSNFNNNIANYLSLNNIFNNNIANNLLNNNVFVNSLNDSIDTDEQNLDSLNLSGTVLEAFIQNGDSASVNLLGLANDSLFVSTIATDTNFTKYFNTSSGYWKKINSTNLLADPFQNGGATTLNAFGSGSNYSILGGGYNNTINNSYSGLITGYKNNISSDYSIIGTGYENIISTSSTYSSIITGYNNTINSSYSIVLSGYQNSTQNSYSFVANGNNNNSEGVYGIVLNGNNNKSYLGYSTVINGYNNKAKEEYSTVINGYNNIANADFSIIAGGYNNEITATYSAILNGYNNNISGYYSIIGSGNENIVTSNYSGILAGSSNKVYFNYSGILSGYNNKSNNYHSAIGAGAENITNGQYSFIGAGYSNQTDGYKSFIGSGYNNETDGNYTSVVGGYNNHSSDNYTAIVGGQNNNASEEYSMVVGGRENIASDDYAVVVGGHTNIASGHESFIGGGDYNSATAEHSSVLGGSKNTASGYSSVALGQENTAKSYGEIVVGCNADNNYTPNSVNSYNLNDRIFVLGNGSSSSSKSNAMTIFKNGKVGIGTNSPSEKLHVNGNVKANSFIVSSDRNYKTNIMRLENNIDKIKLLTPVEYTFRNEFIQKYGFDTNLHLGFIAQEIEKVLPNIVTTQSDGYKAVNYTEIIPVLVGSIQEQQYIIETMKKENTDLKEKLESLMKRVENLEKTDK